MFFNKNTLRFTRYKNIKKSGIIFIKTIDVNVVVNDCQFWCYILLLPYVRFAHIINNRSIATIKASFIVSLNRLFLIAYCITNPAVIK